jgi:hypothetical protein
MAFALVRLWHVWGEVGFDGIYKPEDQYRVAALVSDLIHPLALIQALEVPLGHEVSRSLDGFFLQGLGLGNLDPLRVVHENVTLSNMEVVARH